MKFNIDKFIDMKNGSHYYYKTNSELFEILKRAGLYEDFTMYNGLYIFDGQINRFIPNGKKRYTDVRLIMEVDFKGFISWGIKGRGVNHLNSDIIEMLLKQEKEIIESLIKDKMILLGE